MCIKENVGINIKGGTKKTSLNSQHRFYLISLTKNMLEGWDIIHWKGGIHSFVWSTKTFLYDIWEPRYKQIKMGYQISICIYVLYLCYYLQCFSVMICIICTTFRNKRGNFLLLKFPTHQSLLVSARLICTTITSKL